MSLSPIKQEILETLLLKDKPMKATDAAKETGKEFPPVMMHILGLVRMGYVSSPEKGLYVISQKGKAALGIPEVDKEKAAAILAYLPDDKAFHFYVDVGKPSGFHAHNLRDFANKINKISIESIMFHMSRGDFTAWFTGLGDLELAKKVALLKQRNVEEENIRKQLYDIVEQRYVTLANLAGEPVYAE